MGVSEGHEMILRENQEWNYHFSLFSAQNIKENHFSKYEYFLRGYVYYIYYQLG